MKFFKFLLVLLLSLVPAAQPAFAADNPLKAFPESRLSSLAFTGKAADLIADLGLNTIATSTEKQDMTVFGAVSYSQLRYNTGSHIDAGGMSAVAGFSRSFYELLLGMFAEAGFASYNSLNTFTSLSSVEGEGKTDYAGGGFIVHFDILPQFYAEASARMGNAAIDFDSSSFPAPSQNASYDSQSLYYGAHAGLGYTILIGRKMKADLSGSYLWTHQNNTSVTVNGQRINFAGSDSQRARGKFRLFYALQENLLPYAGAGYDYEFDGELKAKANGQETGAPSLKGGTGIFEAGLSMGFLKRYKLSLDANVSGNAGVREGVTGSLSAKYVF
jgi:outer membrane autotransporter protein